MQVETLYDFEKTVQEAQERAEEIFRINDAKKAAEDAQLREAIQAAKDLQTQNVQSPAASIPDNIAGSPITDRASWNPINDRPQALVSPPLAQQAPTPPSLSDADSGNGFRQVSSKPRKRTAKRPSITSESERRDKMAKTVSDDDSRVRMGAQRGPATLPNSATTSSGVIISGAEALQLPEWYAKLPKPATRSRGSAGIDQQLSNLKRLIAKCEKAASTPRESLRAQEFKEVTDAIHHAMFLPVTAKLLRANALLHPAGLPLLFHSSTSVPATLPFYIKLDAEELYNKWCAADFEPDLLRGLVVGKGKNENLGRVKATSDNLDRTYKGRVRGIYFGNGTLVNGQWWPTQLCTLRDGAHNSAQAGICGKDGNGAYSIVISGDAKYPDIDEGDEVWYCGTDTEGKGLTANTQRMIESVNNKPVRVIRSFNAKNKALAPRKGFRYDGLYDVKSFEVLDKSKERHRFHLVRQAGQDPLRAGDGLEARPSEQELAAYAEIQRTRGYLV